MNTKTRKYGERCGGPGLWRDEQRRGMSFRESLTKALTIANHREEKQEDKVKRRRSDLLQFSQIVYLRSEERT